MEVLRAQAERGKWGKERCTAVPCYVLLCCWRLLPSVLEMHWVLIGMFPCTLDFLRRFEKKKKNNNHFLKPLTLKRKGAFVCPVSFHFYFSLVKVASRGSWQNCTFRLCDLFPRKCSESQMSCPVTLYFIQMQKQGDSLAQVVFDQEKERDSWGHLRRCRGFDSYTRTSPSQG